MCVCIYECNIIDRLDQNITNMYDKENIIKL